MKIISVYFEVDKHNIYARLAKVFEYSVHKHMPDCELELVKISIPVITGERCQHQMVKQEYWLEAALKQTEPFILMDCDIVVTGDLSKAFTNDFDIGITFRDMERKPLNGGMIFCNPTENTKHFMHQWTENCRLAYKNPNIWAEFNKECKGFAQSALYHTLKHNTKCKIHELPCKIWNACDEEWDVADCNTKAWHIKGKMRKSLFKDLGIPSETVYNLWREYERECNSGN